MTVTQSCLTLRDHMDYKPPGSSLSMEFSSQEYWSGLPFPTPGNLPDPGIEPHDFCVSCIGKRILYHCAT